MTANPYRPRSTILRAPGVEPVGAPPVPPTPPPPASTGPARSLSPGSVVLGRYTIQKVIGRGGMATVYLAKNQETERLVALKILDPEISSDPSYVERFRREARAAGRIRSDHVVAIYDLGTDVNGTLVLVMEYLEGQTVQQALRNGRLPIPRIGHLGRHLCEGLAAAHECGVIHRDLKPANLFIERMPAGAEKLKILDFGISKLAEASSQELTRAGQTLGTLAYMAPEQIRGTVKGNDPRIDLYAAGVSIFLMLTAKRPIDAEDTVQLLQAVLEKPPLTLAQASGVEFPPALEAFVARALQKESARRFQNAIEMRDALLSAVSAPASIGGIEEVAEVSSTIISEAPRFDGPLPMSTPSGVIARGGHDVAPPGPVMLPSFDDDEEEGKTVVRAPHSAPNESPAVLPAAGRRLGMAPDYGSPPPGPTPMRAATIAPTGLSGNGPPMYAPPPTESTMLADPATSNPFGAFNGPGMHPQMGHQNAAMGAAVGPPMPSSNPFGPLGGGSPFAPPTYVAPAPAPAPASKRSPMVFVLGAAALVAVALVGLAGKVAVDSRAANNAAARIERSRPAAAAPSPVGAPTVEAVVPVAQPIVAQPIAAPAPIVEAQPLAPAAPVVAAAAPTPEPAPEPAAVPPAPTPASAEPAPAAPAANHVAHTRRAPRAPRAPTTAAAPMAAHTAATPRVVRATPATAAPVPARAPRPRRGGRGVITDLPF